MFILLFNLKCIHIAVLLQVEILRKISYPMMHSPKQASHVKVPVTCCVPVTIVALQEGQTVETWLSWNAVGWITTVVGCWTTVVYPGPGAGCCGGYPGCWAYPGCWGYGAGCCAGYGGGFSLILLWIYSSDRSCRPVYEGVLKMSGKCCVSLFTSRSFPWQHYTVNCRDKLAFYS